MEVGLFDLNTPFFFAEQILSHLEGLSTMLRPNLGIQHYEAGHMMYLRESELAKLKANIVRFLDQSIKP